MNDAKTTITLELELAGDSLSGRAIEGDGTARPFHGWIGLVGVIDTLLAGGISDRLEDQQG